MNCKELHTYLVDYIDGTLDANSRHRVDAHLANCPRCQRQYEAHRSVAERLGTLPKAHAPADFLESVEKKMDARHRLSHRFKSILTTLFVPVRVKVPAEVLAMAALAVLIVYIVQPSSTDSVFAPAPAEDALSARAKRDTFSKGVPAGALPDADREAAEAPPPQAGRAVMEPQRNRRAPVVVTLALSGFRNETSRDFEQKSAPPSSFRAEGKVSEDQSPGKDIAEEAAADRPASDDTAPVPVEPASRALEEIRQAASVHDGEVVSVETDTDGAPATIRVELPSAGYSAFVKELNHNGRLASSGMPESIGSSGGQVTLLIRLVP